MKDVVEIPNAEDFRKRVEEMAEISGISDCIYEKCIEEFTRIKLNLNQER